ncbi:hypothetical protein DCAR_0934283 [Daucus carota subsp. sativus]|uniref:NAC domain-containing protein n=1 Tax=Daucus carota subsp. sativus TaxID=79200 RepID=A0AAF0XV55_DAUCS|nr:PREDICTED: transcription factor JUNGBRUNNEN 1-like [Daucus carota subsp. sativus]WOH14760.1 hypothetical protein DCAR_0934283 [Daucus carota subsp. sativus]
MEREGCQCECLKIPGVCFDPSDEELVAYYQTEKIEGRPLQCNHLMTELPVYHDDLMPWELLKDDNPYWMTSSCDKENKIKKTIYVFTELRKKKSRVIRRSGRGSWTGQNNPVVKDRAGNEIGYNKLLTFYEDTDGKKGKKGKKKINYDDHGHWIMHEYSLSGNDKYVLCKIVKEVRIGTKALILCTNEGTTMRELPDMICGKNGQTDGACTGLDGAANDSCSGVDEIQDFMTADAPRIEAVDVNNQADDNMEGKKQILDDFWNFELDDDVSPTDTAWDGLDDVILDFSSPDLFDLWPVEETQEQSCRILENQAQKKMSNV